MRFARSRVAGPAPGRELQPGHNEHAITGAPRSSAYSVAAHPVPLDNHARVAEMASTTLRAEVVARSSDAGVAADVGPNRATRHDGRGDGFAHGQPSAGRNERVFAG
jgi:hypothetical protein